MHQTMFILIVPNPVVLPELSEEHRRRIEEAAGAGARVVLAKTLEEQVRHAPEADVVLGLVPREAFLAARKLRWVQALASGVDEIGYPELMEGDVVLTSEKGLVGNQLAEHAFGLPLALTRGIGAHARRKS